jgi:small subunit ribosomal protein S6
MRPYEIMVILDAGLEDDAIRSTIDRATKIIAAEGGTVGRVDRWGKRRFAYEVNHRSEGYYALIEATAEPAAMAVLDRALGLADEVVRHKVIRLPEKVAGRTTRRPANDASPAVATNANGA